jgi:hypothetical protein
VSELPAAVPANVAFWVDMVGRLDALGMRSLEAQLALDFSAESLGPVHEAIARRRQALAQAIPVPSCSYCGGPCNKVLGWFVVEHWEGGRAVARGAACGGGCLIAVAHSQKPRGADSPPLLKGALEPLVEHARVVEPLE